MVAHPFNSRALKEEGGRVLYEFEARLVYTASPRPVTATQQSLASNKTKQNKKLKKAKQKEKNNFIIGPGFYFMLSYPIS